MILNNSFEARIYCNETNIFIDIVHATFKDANGYVEGLSEEKVDELIEQYYQSQLNPQSSTLDQNLVQNLHSAWKNAQENVNSLFELDMLKVIPSLFSLLTLPGPYFRHSCLQSQSPSFTLLTSRL